MMTAGLRVVTAAAFWAAGLSSAHAISTAVDYAPDQDYAPGETPACTSGVDISTSTFCEGIFAEGRSDTSAPLTDGISRVPGDVGSTDAGAVAAIEHNEFVINSDGGFAGFDTWELSSELNNRTVADVAVGDSAEIFLSGAPTGNTFSFTVDSGSDLASGTWSVDDWSGVQEAAIAILTGGNFWSIYLLDLTSTSGAWTVVDGRFDFNYGFAEGPTNYPLSGPKSQQLTSLQLYTVAATSEVPVPAAAPLLVGALGAFGLLRRRRKA